MTRAMSRPDAASRDPSIPDMRMVNLLATCAMLWLGATALGIALVLGLTQHRDRRRGAGRMRRS